MLRSRWSFDKHFSKMSLKLLVEQPLDACQCQLAYKSIWRCPCRKAEGEPTSVATFGFDTVTGGRNPSHAPIPVGKRFESIDGKRHPNAKRCLYAADRSFTNKAIPALDVAHGRSPPGPHLRIGDQSPNSVDRGIQCSADG